MRKAKNVPVGIKRPPEKARPDGEVQIRPQYASSLALLRARTRFPLHERKLSYRRHHFQRHPFDEACHRPYVHSLADREFVTGPVVWVGGAEAVEPPLLDGDESPLLDDGRLRSWSKWFLRMVRPHELVWSPVEFLALVRLIVPSAKSVRLVRGERGVANPAVREPARPRLVERPHAAPPVAIARRLRYVRRFASLQHSLHALYMVSRCLPRQ